MAILMAVFTAVVVTALGISLALLGSAETAVAGHDTRARAAIEAAHGAMTLAASDLRAMSDWSGVTAAGAVAGVCATPGRFVDATLGPAAPWDASVIDLPGLTARLQADSDSAAPPGVTGRVWRLFHYGPISRLNPPGGRPPPLYLATWIADGGSGRLLIRSVALGPRGLVRAAEAAVARRTDGTSLVRLSLRSAR